MVFIIHQNRRFFVWLRWTFLLFFVLIFFILDGPSLIVRGSIMISKTFSFSNTENTVSSAKIVALQAKIIDLEIEQERLKALLGNTERFNKIIPANISFSGGYLFSDSIVIDRGEMNGVAINDYVVTQDGIFIGSITRLEAYWSRAIPFTQLGHKTIVRGGQNKEIIFEVSGIGGGEAAVDLPVGMNIKTGDIFWSGEHPNFIIGIVDSIDASPAKQIQTVYFRPPIAFKFLISVNIHKKNI